MGHEFPNPSSRRTATDLTFLSSKCPESSETGAITPVYSDLMYYTVRVLV